MQNVCMKQKIRAAMNDLQRRTVTQTTQTKERIK